MSTVFTNIFSQLISTDILRQEWFWAIVAIMISVLIFAWEQGSANKISRAGFIYNISNDFANNDRILKVYQWIEECRRQNQNVRSCRHLTFSTSSSVFQQTQTNSPDLEFIDIDTYINHFESVYIILENVQINSIDELFQQRFFTFMMNPYIQKEELFECFSSDVNDFRLCKKWIMSIYRRKHYDVQALVEYLHTYTCGTFELSKPILWEKNPIKRLIQHHKISNYLLNYIDYICDPQCRYGYYPFFNKASDRKVLRIIEPSIEDLDSILQLQDTVTQSLSNSDHFYPSTQAELSAAIRNPDRYWTVQVLDGEKVAAFAYVIRDPDAQYDLYTHLSKRIKPSDRCVFETVFVHPDYRGYGIQSVLIDVLCAWAKENGKRSICATVHPENKSSINNFTQNGFVCVTEAPIAKYGSTRNLYLCDLTKKSKSKAHYTVYPYV